jgi:hypothetical protein
VRQEGRPKDRCCLRRAGVALTSDAATRYFAMLSTFDDRAYRGVTLTPEYCHLTS